MNPKQTARIHRGFEVMWLAIIAISIVEVYARWGDWTQVGIFALFGGLGIFRYTYSRKQRMRLKNRD